MTNLPVHESFSPSWRQVLATTVRLLTFRATAAELAQLTGRHLFFGLICSWVVGIGRYWDNPRVPWIQHLGIGSVIYVFILSLLLWLVLWPFKPRHWSYFRVATFVSLVAPPAILYAIPVELFFSIDTANSLNVLFLAIVAVWRVALLLFLLRRLGGLDWFRIVVGTSLPLIVIVVALTALNLERVVFDLMGGIRERSAADSSYVILFLLSYLSILLFLPVLLCYVVLAATTLIKAGKGRRDAT